MNDFSNLYSCERISASNCDLLLELCRLVVETNYRHHCRSLPPSVEEEIAEVYVEELRYAPYSWFYVLRNTHSQRVVGCIRAVQWQEEWTLPAEAKFNVNMRDFLRNRQYEQVFHIGRFAVSEQEMKRLSTTLFKSLMVTALYIPYLYNKSIVLAELDENLFKILQLLHLHFMPIGNTKIELGSETIPVYIKSSELHSFVEEYKHLCFFV